jgi:IclR family transcriptional regulator, acetate operon repressor
MSRSQARRGVLEGAFGLLTALERAQEAGLTGLAARSGLPKGTAHRLLEQLISVGAVERSSGRYRLGPQVFVLGRHWQPYPGLHTVAAGPVRQLASDTGTTVAICALSGGATLVTAVVPGEADRVMPLRAGAVTDWPTAAGKLLMAYRQQEPAPFWTSSAQWAREADTIRKRGLAFDHEEFMPGLYCVAAPLRGPDGETIASLSAMTLSPRTLAALGAAVTRTAAIINADLRCADPSG